MPLRDHFRPPLAQLRHWESFHAAWATEIMRTLNRHVLPPGCFAEAQVHVGSRVEIDVATFEHATPGHTNGGVAVDVWAPPTATATIPAVFPDEIEVQVFRTAGGAELVAAIELVSPGNKDRPEARRAFAAKCAAYLQQGVGVVFVDIVTERQANLNNEVMRLLGQSEEPGRADALYAVAYRPSRQETGDQIELWLNPLTLGSALPTMPLVLRGMGTVPLDLETTYGTTCADSRL